MIYKYFFIIIVGTIFGIIVIYYMNNKIMIICTSYIGATIFVSEIMNLFFKIKFVRIGDITIFFGDSLEEISLNLLGIEIPTFIGFLLIVGGFILSYYIR